MQFGALATHQLPVGSFGGPALRRGMAQDAARLRQSGGPLRSLGTLAMGGALEGLGILGDGDSEIEVEMRPFWISILSYIYIIIYI